MRNIVDGSRRQILDCSSLPLRYKKIVLLPFKRYRMIHLGQLYRTKFYFSRRKYAMFYSRNLMESFITNMLAYMGLIFVVGEESLRRRSRAEVIVDILSEALKGANKTRIMYRANLNFVRFDRYFSELLAKGLIVVVDNPGVYSGGVVYQTTEKGRALLEILKQAGELVSL